MSESNDQFENDHRKNDPFEAELARWLKRKKPSPGFAGRVLAAARKEDAPRFVNRWQRFAIAAGLLAMLSSAGLYLLQDERQIEQAAAEEASRQALMALRITAGTLAVAREKVLQAGAQSAGDSQSPREQMQGDQK